MLKYIIIPLSFLVLISCDSDDSPSTACTNSVDMSTYNYLMAYHTCDSATTTCSDPSNHVVQLAASADGISWTPQTAFTSYSGSVPDLATDGTYVYIYTGDNNVRIYDSNLCHLETAAVSFSGTDSTGGFVDPSFIQENGVNYIFYLPGTPGSDPAGCSTYPCTKTIHSMESTSDTFASFTQSTGDRISESLSNGALSDPDIIKFGSTFLLYISKGQDVEVYSSSTITGSYVSQGTVSSSEGGVPSAIVGSDSNVWIYTTNSSSGTEVIKRGVTADGTTAPTSYTEVINGTTIGASATTNVSSPSILDKPASW